MYFADQSQFPTVDEAELKAMDEEIGALEEEVKELQTQITAFRTGKSYNAFCWNAFWWIELKELDSALSDEDLKKGITTMTEETQKMEERVNALQGYGLNSVSNNPYRADVIDPKELDILRKEITKAQKIWRQRRGLCREMAGNLADSMEKKDEEIYVKIK